MNFTFQELHLFQILKRYETQHLPLDLFLSFYFKSHKSLGAHDRRMIAETIYGMTRWRDLIDFLIPPPQSWEKRYAFFKKFHPEDYVHAHHIPLHTRVSFPQFLFHLIKTHHGLEKAMELCRICNTPAPITLRINPMKTSREDLIDRLSPLCEMTPCSYSSLGIQCSKRIPLFELQEFKDGLFEVQDEGSQLVSDLVKAEPGDQVLDFCAGSGGKTLAFAHRLKNTGQIYLHDVRQTALEQAKKRLHRAGIQNTQVLSADHKYWEKLKKKMDWVLVDAPCSGTGTLRRNPDMKEKFSKEMLTRLVGQQRGIFEKALSFLAPAGKIVYATCSILQEENEKQITHFLKTYRLKLCAPPFVSLPSAGGMDGFFAACLSPL